MMRINKFLAQSGIAARRKCDELVTQGLVKVNGKVVTQLGRTIDEINDVVECEGKTVTLVRDFTYILLNKPVDTISSVEDKHRRPTVVEMVESEKRIFPVGRLDYNTTGVLLLTDDGELTNKLLHPRYKKPKIYSALVDKKMRPADMHRFKSGLEIDGEMTAPCKIKQLRLVDNCSLLEVELREGKKRQIRLMLEALGYHVEELDRIEFAGLNYKGLKRGQWRYLNPEEIVSLKSE